MFVAEVCQSYATSATIIKKIGGIPVMVPVAPHLDSLNSRIYSSHEFPNHGI